MTSLKQIILDLQEAISDPNNKLTKYTVVEKTAELDGLGYKYDFDKFPVLLDANQYADTSGDTPATLAEALLWKLGKWKSYKNFVSQYIDNDAEPSQKGVVFFAFAKHLQDSQNPIYDQHALRALWSICLNLDAAHKNQCKSLLFKKDGTWKPAGEGVDTVNCYNIFVDFVGRLTAVEGGLTKRDLDCLLMPLGQAIKKKTSNYNELCDLCGWG
jgi:hypothetical protein